MAERSGDAVPDIAFTLAALLNSKAGGYQATVATGNHDTIEAYKNILASYNELEDGICDSAPKGYK